MTEEDIKKQLEEKNKEIYLKKLNLDLENNLEVLKLTIDNLLEKVSEESTKNVLGIAETFQKKDEINECINNYLNSYHDIFIRELELKKKSIEDILLIKKIDEYKEYLKEISNKFIDKIEKESLNNIDSLEKKLKEKFDDLLYQERIEDYLKNIFLENLNQKVKDTIKGRDIILLNTFKETYLKYLELNKNTIGI